MSVLDSAHKKTKVAHLCGVMRDAKFIRFTIRCKKPVQSKDELY